MNTTLAREFLTRCFAPGDTIAVLLRRENPASTKQRIVALEKVIAPRYLGWLSYENANGANVYVAANPLRSGSRKRTKESIAEVRHLYIDIDVDGETRVATLRASNEVPASTAIIATSQGKYQVLWRVEGFDFADQESTLKRLTIAFGGDPACTDCNRVIRVPGFHNRKYLPAHPVTVEYVSDSIYSPSDFQLDEVTPDTMLPLRGVALSFQGKKHTPSEQDWAWVLSELTRGQDAAKLTQSLASRRADKPNPLYYAQRTVDMASARLALLAGSPIHDVIAMLQARRIAELPVALRFTRAREIAHTAARMIARKEIA
jgi:RepB DNA-primase from phage plasmid